MAEAGFLCRHGFALDHSYRVSGLAKQWADVTPITAMPSTWTLMLSPHYRIASNSATVANISQRHQTDPDRCDVKSDTRAGIERHEHADNPKEHQHEPVGGWCTRHAIAD